MKLPIEFPEMGIGGGTRLSLHMSEVRNLQGCRKVIEGGRGKLDQKGVEIGLKSFFFSFSSG